MRKRFDEWIKLKKILHKSNKSKPIKEGEIWWCAMGENVGTEINGKHSRFDRPVLIFKKLSQYQFLGVPLSTKYHRGSWYVPYTFQGKHCIAVLCQIKIISIKRLYERKGELDETDFLRIKKGFKKLYLE